MNPVQNTGLRAVAIAFAAVAAISLGACGKSGPEAAGAPTHFVNSQADAKSPDLSANYIDFSFDYPANWKVDPKTGTATAANFIKVERDDDSGITIENFAVGDFQGTGDPAKDAAQIPGALGQLETQVSSMPGYKRLSIGEATTINGVAGQQLTFSATPQVGGKTGNLFGRIIILPQPGTSKGVTLIMLGTDTSGELASVADLGVKGQLPMILNSFKFAPAPAADANAAPAAPADDSNAAAPAAASNDSN
jgi:PsbP-like protein